MRAVRNASGSVLLACVGALALAPSAFAATFTLTLSGPQNAVVGQPFALTANGTDPTDQGALYLEVDAIPASVTSSCPSGYLDGSQLATSTGGALVAFDDRENLDSAGSFSMPVGYTAKVAEETLFCGYTDDGAADTLATASWLVNVQPAGGQTPPPTGTPPPTATTGKPINDKKPHVTRSRNVLTCSRGSWANNPVNFSFRWIVDGRTRHGARSVRLTVTRGLRGRQIRCSVTASNAAGVSSASSAPFTVH